VSQAGPFGVRFAVVALAIASAAAARLLAHVAIADVPHVMDEVAYLFEAKLMASGHVTGPVALPRAAFNMWFVDDRAARFAIFPPGWSAVLALGVRLGLTRWVNPILHFATVILVGRAGARLGGPRLEIAAAALYAASPQAVLLAASLMSHSLVALAGAVVALAIAATFEPTAPRRSLFAWAGAAVGAALVTRPLCAVVLAAGLVIGMVGRGRTRDLPLAAASAAPFALALAVFNRTLTGSPFRFAQNAYFDEHLAPANVPFFTYGKGCNALGFGAACDYTVRGAAHTLYSALTDATDNLRAWGILLAGPVVAVGVGLALSRAGARPKALYLLALPVLSIVLYGLYWQAGVCYGARFYHAALPAFVLAAALGLATAVSRGPRALVAATLGCVLVFDAVGYVVALRELTSWSWWGTDDRFSALRARWSQGPAVVMVAFGRDDVRSPSLVATGAASEGSWLLGIRALAALGENEPAVDRGGVVFAKFHPALVDELSARFPGRSLWVYTAWADRAKDTLEPWRESQWSGHTYRPPADNFDGFRVGPPYVAPDPLLREATDEGWPP
jgi:hypothetical protein